MVGSGPNFPNLQEGSGEMDIPGLGEVFRLRPCDYDSPESSTRSQKQMNRRWPIQLSESEFREFTNFQN